MSFINLYNQQVDFLFESDDIPAIDEIDKNDLNEFKKENNHYWQELLKHDDYNLKAKYNSEKQLDGYSVYSTGDVDFNEQGIVSAIAVAKSLGLDVQEYHDQFVIALESNEPINEYKESNYEISFLIVVT